MSQPERHRYPQQAGGGPPPSSPYLGAPQPTAQYGSPQGHYAGLPPGATNPWSIAALVLGLCGTAILAVVAGHVALSQISRTGESGRGLAIAGLVLGYLEIVLYVLLVAGLFGFFVWAGSAGT